MVEDEEPATSWFYDLLSDAKLLARLARRWQHWNERFDLWLSMRIRPVEMEDGDNRSVSVGVYAAGGLALLGLLYVAYLASRSLVAVPAAQWSMIVIGLLATLLR